MITCRECNKRFRIKLNSSRFGIKLKEGYQTTCPYCGYVIYLGDVDQVKYLLIFARVLSVLVASFLGMNTRLLRSQERLILVGGGALVFVFIMHHLSLWIAGKVYDWLSN